ncbi:MAG: Molybdopterin adenylyltransferase [Firmicutes bacterium]|nr:Molybdopterin adenylyltransferase [candidate division NPL-UPA2 bacterium]
MRVRVVAVNVSVEKGTRKTPVEHVTLRAGLGVEGDAHAGHTHRQVSLLPLENIAEMQKLGLLVGPGDFAENITTQGMSLARLPLGTRLTTGTAVLSITQVGKVCHERCAIYYQAGDCVMPREGVFAEVLRDGVVASGMSLIAWPRFRVLVVTLSDRCFGGEQVDESGRVLADEFALLGALVTKVLLPDEFTLLRDLLIATCDANRADLIVTTGGTGLSPRDVTPEATRASIEREAPGFAEAMRMHSLAITPHAMLSRAVAGTRKQTLIVNLPGSAKGAMECLQVFLPALPHALDVLSGVTLDCGRSH